MALIRRSLCRVGYTVFVTLKSEEKCYCFLNPLSSFIPSDSATVGGYVIQLITAYQQEKRVTFGLYSCPKTNEFEADNIIKWWD